MKKLLCSLCAILIMALPLAACAPNQEDSDSAYEPKREDFEFSVGLGKTEYEKGERIDYTVKLTRKDGPRFQYKGSSTLCGVYFQPVETDEEPYFPINDDYVTIVIPQDYVYEEGKSLSTDSCESGEYLFAVAFFMQGITYNYEQVITIVDSM